MPERSADTMTAVQHIAGNTLEKIRSSDSKILFILEKGTRCIGIVSEKIFVQTEMFVGQLGCDAPSLGPDYEAFLDKERLIYFLQGPLILAYCGREGTRADRTALEKGDDSAEYLVVYGVEAPFVYLQFIEGEAGNLQIDVSVSHHLGEVAHPPEKGVRDSGRAAAAERNLFRSFLVY